MHRRSWLVVGVAAVVLGGAATAYAQSRNDQSGSDPSGHYRTVTASLGKVEETLTTSGTVDSAHRADVAFGVSGTVSKVKVHQGQTVRTGDVLVTLNRTSLVADVEQAKAVQAKARAQLASDEDAQDTTVTSSVTATRSGSGRTNVGLGSTKPGGGKPTGGHGGSPGGGQTGGGQTGTQTGPVRDALKQLTEQQQAVTTAQTKASQDLADARAALATQTKACASAFQSQPGGTPSDGATEGSTEGRAGSTADDPQDVACTKALADVQAKQQLVDDAQQVLATALGTLAGTLDNALTLLEKANAGTTSGSTTSPSAYRSTGATVAESADYVTTGSATSVVDVEYPIGSGDTSATTGGQSAGAQSTGGTVTAARLATDQAAIDTARADLITARAALARTVVKATMSGRVVSLDVNKGDAVQSGDTAAVVTSGRSLLVEGVVTESKIRSIRTGQNVRVTGPGSSTVSTGAVSAIGMTADASTGTASYPVTVVVARPKVALPAGSQVVLEIVLDTVDDAVTVPSSAVSKFGTRSVVRTLKDGSLTSTAVTVGTVGSRRTQITRGITAGTEVVLADLDEQVSGASTSLRSSNGFGGFGGFGGANGGLPGRAGRSSGSGGGPPG